MIGILVLLAISWLLLYFLEKKSILALGLQPTTRRVQEFLVGFVITALLCTGTQLLRSTITSITWHLNNAIDPGQIAQMLWWDLRSVLTEELIFRGALLLILMERIGVPKSLWISSGAFGIYHWFSYGIFGNVIPMVLVFVGTGMMGYAWALAFAKTRSVFLPLGLHLGWNAAFNTVFSKGPLGQGVFVDSGQIVSNDWSSLIGLLVVPVIVWLFVRYGVRPANSRGAH